MLCKLSMAAEMLVYPSSTCSLHGACNIPCFYTHTPQWAEPTDRYFAQTSQQIHACICFSTDKPDFLAVPAHTVQTSHSK